MVAQKAVPDIQELHFILHYHQFFMEAQIQA